jgi:hypothetical protein
VGYAEVQHQRQRARRIRDVASQVDVPTMLTPSPNHLSSFCLMGCAKDVSNLVNHPIVSLLGTRVGSTRAKVIPKQVYLKLPATTTRERLLLNLWDLGAHVSQLIV